LGLPILENPLKIRRIQEILEIQLKSENPEKISRIHKESLKYEKNP
jgi:hypothetical protein